jgi:mono/diheme cytochrome c family protein
VSRAPVILWVALFLCTLPSTARADASAGEKLASANGCAGCHGAGFGGGVGPKLFGIEHRRTTAQIADAIENPKPPMPKFPLSHAQVVDVVAYLSSLDGGGGQPVATLDPARPTKKAVLSVRFPGSPPARVIAVPRMRMGTSTMTTATVTLHPTSDAHLWKAAVIFSMGGPWTIDVIYGGKHLLVPVNVAGSM